MKTTGVRIGVCIPLAGPRFWHQRLLTALGDAAIAVEWIGESFKQLPMPWAALLGLEKLFAKSRSALFAKVRIPAVPLDRAAVDLLVVASGERLDESLLGRFRLGVLCIEPVHPGHFGKGIIHGRVLWHRAGRRPRLAGHTATCVSGPFPLSWFGTHLAKMALMPARALAGIQAGGERFWESCPEAAAPQPPYSPSLGTWRSVLVQVAGFGLKKAWEDIFHRRQWFLAIRSGNGDPLRPGFEAEPFAAVPLPKGLGWADPQVCLREGRRWLFFEEIPGRRKGHISVTEIGADNTVGPSRKVLDEPFHLSYPVVFEHGGAMYMVPETAQARQVRLYRSTDFPGGWMLDRVLLDNVPATDATFLEHGGKWWLFVNIRPEGGSSWDELHVFHSADRFGPYMPHPRNPVVSDVRRARPAGKIVKKDGRLFRPAQDCSGWYGRALAMTEIIRLDTEGYEEREYLRLEPGLIPGSFCLHTFESDGALEIVDGQRFVPIWR